MEGKTRGRGQVAEIALTQMNRPHPPGKRGVCHRREHVNQHVSCMSSKTNVAGLKHTDVAAALRRGGAWLRPP